MSISLGNIISIDFATERPENNFKGNPDLNSQLVRDWLGEDLTVDEEDLEYIDSLMDMVLNYIEDTSGWLVKNVVVKSDCVKEVFKEDYSFPSLSGDYPENWMWNREISIIPSTSNF